MGNASCYPSTPRINGSNLGLLIDHGNHQQEHIMCREQQQSKKKTIKLKRKNMTKNFANKENLDTSSEEEGESTSTRKTLGFKTIKEKLFIAGHGKGNLSKVQKDNNNEVEKKDIVSDSFQQSRKIMVQRDMNQHNDEIQSIITKAKSTIESNNNKGIKGSKINNTLGQLRLVKSQHKKLDTCINDKENAKVISTNSTLGNLMVSKTENFSTQANERLSIDSSCVLDTNRFRDCNKVNILEKISGSGGGKCLKANNTQESSSSPIFTSSTDILYNQIVSKKGSNINDVTSRLNSECEAGYQKPSNKSDKTDRHSRDTFDENQLRECFEFTLDLKKYNLNYGISFNDDTDTDFSIAKFNQNYHNEKKSSIALTKKPDDNVYNDISVNESNYDNNSSKSLRESFPQQKNLTYDNGSFAHKPNLLSNHLDCCSKLENNNNVDSPRLLFAANESCNVSSEDNHMRSFSISKHGTGGFMIKFEEDHSYQNRLFQPLNEQINNPQEISVIEPLRSTCAEQTRFTLGNSLEEADQSRSMRSLNEDSNIIVHTDNNRIKNFLINDNNPYPSPTSRSTMKDIYSISQNGIRKTFLKHHKFEPFNHASNEDVSTTTTQSPSQHLIMNYYDSKQNNKILFTDTTTCSTSHNSHVGFSSFQDYPIGFITGRDTSPTHKLTKRVEENYQRNTNLSSSVREGDNAQHYETTNKVKEFKNSKVNFGLEIGSMNTDFAFLENKGQTKPNKAFVFTDITQVKNSSFTNASCTGNDNKHLDRVDKLETIKEYDQNKQCSGSIISFPIRESLHKVSDDPQARINEVSSLLNAGEAEGLKMLAKRADNTIPKLIDASYDNSKDQIQFETHDYHHHHANINEVIPISASSTYKSLDSTNSLPLGSIHQVNPKYSQPIEKSTSNDKTLHIQEFSGRLMNLTKAISDLNDNRSINRTKKTLESKSGSNFGAKTNVFDKRGEKRDSSDGFSCEKLQNNTPLVQDLVNNQHTQQIGQTSKQANNGLSFCKSFLINESSAISAIENSSLSEMKGEIMIKLNNKTKNPEDVAMNPIQQQRNLAQSNQFTGLNNINNTCISREPNHMKETIKSSESKISNENYRLVHLSTNSEYGINGKPAINSIELSGSNPIDIDGKIIQANLDLESVNNGMNIPNPCSSCSITTDTNIEQNLALTFPIANRITHGYEFEDKFMATTYLQGAKSCSESSSIGTNRSVIDINQAVRNSCHKKVGSIKLQSLISNTCGKDNCMDKAMNISKFDDISKSKAIIDDTLMGKDINEMNQAYMPSIHGNKDNESVDISVNIHGSYFDRNRDYKFYHKLMKKYSSSCKERFINSSNDNWRTNSSRINQKIQLSKSQPVKHGYNEDNEYSLVKLKLYNFSADKSDRIKSGDIEFDPTFNLNSNDNFCSKDGYDGDNLAQIVQANKSSDLSLSDSSNEMNDSSRITEFNKVNHSYDGNNRSINGYRDYEQLNMMINECNQNKSDATFESTDQSLFMHFQNNNTNNNSNNNSNSNMGESSSKISDLSVFYISNKRIRSTNTSHIDDML